MDQPDRDRTNELIPAEGLDEAEPLIGPVAMEMRVAVRVFRIGLVVRVQVLVWVPVNRRRRREALGELAQSAGQVEDTEHDEHDRDPELHRQPDSPAG